MPTIVVFGSPVQRWKKEGESLWHIPVTIRPWLKFGPAGIDDCAFYLDEYEKGEIVDKISLAVGDAAFQNVSERVQLVKDRVFLIPVAWRSESDESMNGHITDTRFFGKGERAYPLSPDRKKRRYRLRVKYGKKKQESPHFYLLRVPKTRSNGHFVLEIEYEGEGRQ